MTKKTRITALVVAVALSGALAGCADGAGPETLEPPVTAPQNPSDDGSTGQDDGASDISMEEAGVIATDVYGGTITSIEDDDHDDEPTWKVELSGSSEGDIDVEVSKATGEILSVEDD